jgi:hypothetical protein
LGNDISNDLGNALFFPFAPLFIDYLFRVNPLQLLHASDEPRLQILHPPSIWEVARQLRSSPFDDTWP